MKPAVLQKRDTPVFGSLLRDLQGALVRMDRLLLPPNSLEEPLRGELVRVLTAGGKRLRPSLGYICSTLGQEARLPILPLMSMLELMHTASLIHDDVVDGAPMRRGIATINAVSGTATAIAAGDYLLAQAMDQLHYYKGTAISKTLAETSEDMCLGELSLLSSLNEAAPQTASAYFLQIHRKTASLISAACVCGGIVGGLGARQQDHLRQYGENLGCAFQLCDDLLDFSPGAGFGKSPGQDLKNNIFTYPVLYLLENGLPTGIVNLLLKKNKNDRDIHYLLSTIRDSAALPATAALIRKKTAEAVRALEFFPGSAGKSALLGLAENLSRRQV